MLGCILGGGYGSWMLDLGTQLSVRVSCSICIRLAVPGAGLGGAGEGAAQLGDHSYTFVGGALVRMLVVSGMCAFSVLVSLLWCCLIFVGGLCYTRCRVGLPLDGIGLSRDRATQL